MYSPVAIFSSNRLYGSRAKAPGLAIIGFPGILPGSPLIMFKAKKSTMSSGGAHESETHERFVVSCCPFAESTNIVMILDVAIVCIYTPGPEVSTD